MRVCKNGCDVLLSRVFLTDISKKQLSTFSLLTKPNLKRLGGGEVRRILKSYFNRRLRLGFAKLCRIHPALHVPD